MRHRVATSKLHRESAPRAALLRALTRSLILEEKIETTLAKARAVRPLAERMITVGKRKDRNARRLLTARLRDQEAVNRLMTSLAKRYQTREGGYTRILKMGFRPGDGATMARLALVNEKTKRA